MPLMHLTSVVFQGIKPTSQYLALTKIGASFIALDAQSRLFSWDLNTGLQKLRKIDGKRTPYVSVPENFEGYQTW